MARANPIPPLSPFARQALRTIQNRPGITITIWTREMYPEHAETDGVFRLSANLGRLVRAGLVERRVNRRGETALKLTARGMTALER